MARHQRQIGPIDGMVCKLTGKAFMCGVSLCDHQQAGCVLVDTMYDAWPRNAANTGQLSAAMVEQSVNERSVQISGCWMDHQPGWLIKNEQIFVLVNDDQRDVLCLCRCWGSLWYGDLKRRARRWLYGWLRRLFAIKHDASLAYQGFHPFTREATRHGKRLVESVSTGPDKAFDDAFPLNHA